MTVLPKHFDIQDWRACFKLYRELERNRVYSNLRLVISNHTYSEGYWIENSTRKLPKCDIGYRDEAVWELYQRIKTIIEEKELQGKKHFGLIL